MYHYQSCLARIQPQLEVDALEDSDSQNVLIANKIPLPLIRCDVSPSEFPSRYNHNLALRLQFQNWSSAAPCKTHAPTTLQASAANPIETSSFASPGAHWTYSKSAKHRFRRYLRTRCGQAGVQPGVVCSMRISNAVVGPVYTSSGQRRSWDPNKDVA